MASWAKAALIACLAILAPVKAMVITASVLVIFDMITGIMAARKSGLPITSAGLRRTVSKMIIYTAGIILTFITEKYLLEGYLPVCNWMTGMIGMVELMSCLENLNTLSGTNLLQSIIDKLGSQNK